MNEGIAVSVEDYYAPLDSWMDVRAYPSSDGLSVFFQNVNARKRAAASKLRFAGIIKDEHDGRLASGHAQAGCQNVPHVNELPACVAHQGELPAEAVQSDVEAMAVIAGTMTCRSANGMIHMIYQEGNATSGCHSWLHLSDSGVSHFSTAVRRFRIASGTSGSASGSWSRPVSRSRYSGKSWAGGLVRS